MANQKPDWYIVTTGIKGKPETKEEFLNPRKLCNGKILDFTNGPTINLESYTWWAPRTLERKPTPNPRSPKGFNEWYKQIGTKKVDGETHYIILETEYIN